MRSHAEQLAAIARPELIKRAADKVHPNLFVVFPALTEPKVLAAALGRDGGLLELLLVGSDASQVAALVGAEPVRSVAAPILKKHSGLVKKLPRYADMSATGRHGVDELAAAEPEHSKARHRLDDERNDELDGSARAAHQGERLGEARATKTLVEAIEALAERHTRADHSIEAKHDPTSERQAKSEEHQIAETDALAILAERKSEVPALLTDRTLHPVVTKLTKSIDLPPDVAIPWIDPAELARMPNAATWWMTFRDPLVLLHRLADNKQAQLLVAGGLNTGTMGALTWLEKVPKGFELDSAEDRVIEQLRPLIRDAGALRELFHVRFGIPAPDYNVKMLGDLWNLIGRLPASHLKQERISSFNKAKMGEAAGQYVQGDHRIDIGDTVEPGKQKETFYAEAAEGWYTRDQLKTSFGYDDVRIDELTLQDRFNKKVVAGELQYQLKEQPIDLFTQVVLHEIGHAVDDMFGARTPPVWDYAGWHAFSDATFDDWATEMGGWDKVTPGDKAQIRAAWTEAARGKMAVNTLVGSDHPAVSKKYEKVGLVKAGIEGKSLYHTERTQIGDRVFVAGSYVDAWYSVKASIAQSAPSYYSLNAPAEYFAESYVEYYRGVDGSPGSQAKKGGALAVPVKQWFDENVDKLKYDPQRFKGGASDRASDAAEQANAVAGSPKTTSKPT